MGAPQLVSRLCLELTAETMVMKAAEEVNATDFGNIVRSTDKLTQASLESHSQKDHMHPSWYTNAESLVHHLLDSMGIPSAHTR